MKNFLSFAVKFAVSVALIWYVLRDVDLGASLERLSGLSPGFLLAMAALFVVVLANNTVRWQIVLAAIAEHLPFRTAFRVFYIGTFFNQTLPSSVGGDAVRMYLVRREGLSLGGAIGGIVLERIATLTGLIILVVATQPFLLARIGDNPAKWVFPALAALAVLGILFLMVLDRMPQGLRRWPAVEGIARFAGDTRRLFLAPRYGLSAIALGVVGFSLISSLVYLMAQALGLAVTLLDCLVLVPPVMLVTTIPISIAGWGVREAAMVEAFALIGVAREDSVLLSLVFGFLLLAASLPGGLVWLAGGHKRGDVAREAAQAGDGN